MKKFLKTLVVGLCLFTLLCCALPAAFAADKTSGSKKEENVYAIGMDFNDIAYILVLHCEYGLRHLTNYPDSDVKSMGSEHNSRFRKPMRDRTYSIL